jgi:hypothetical protein
MCIVLSVVVIALCMAIRVVCLHDVSMIAIGEEGADQGEEEPSHHHVAPRMSLPHEPSQRIPSSASFLCTLTPIPSHPEPSQRPSPSPDFSYHDESSTSPLLGLCRCDLGWACANTLRADQDLHCYQCLRHSVQRVRLYLPFHFPL